MPAYQIIGPSGTGKTTIGETLAKKGYRVIDTDTEEGLSGWLHTNTKSKPETIPKPPFPKEWLEVHEWGWYHDRMEELLSAVGAEAVFFCGGASNDSEFSDRFEKIFGLYAPNEIVKKRLQSREPLRWSDDSFELERMLLRNERFVADCEGSEIVLVDSSLNPQIVADAILANL